MKIYLVSLSMLLSFVGIGLVTGIYAAYGAGGLPIDHPLAPIIVVAAVLFFVAIILKVIIITNNGIVYLATGFYDIRFQKTPYEKISGISLACTGRVKIVLWPSQYDGDIVGDKIMFLDIELEDEKKKRRLPLRLFGSRNRIKIVRAILKNKKIKGVGVI